MSRSTVRRAAIDIGTVTTRLLVADTDGERVCEVLRRTEVTHLGRGLHASGVLSEDAIADVASVVRSFAREAGVLEADETVAVATSAARDARNREELLSALAEAGVRAKVISGDTEALLSFVGATYRSDGDDVLVADLGGGSTELVFGAAARRGPHGLPEIAAAHSFDIGSRRVLEMFLSTDPPTADELASAAAWVRAEIAPYFASLRAKPRTLVTLAGTGTTLAAVSMGLSPYDGSLVHGHHLPAAEITRLRELLAGMTVAERRGVAGMDPARADVIVAGAVILEAIVRSAGLEDTLVSEHDILYGLVLLGSDPAVS